MNLDLDCLKLRVTWGMVKGLCGILGIRVIYIKSQTVFQTWAANRNPHGHTLNRTVLICSRVTSHTDNFVAIYLQLVKDSLNNIRIQKLVFTFCFRHLTKRSNTLFHTNLNVLCGIYHHLIYHTTIRRPHPSAYQYSAAATPSLHVSKKALRTKPWTVGKASTIMTISPRLHIQCLLISQLFCMI